MPRIHLREWTAPAALLGACLLAFGLTIPWLGLYADDWPFVYVNHLAGWRGTLARPQLGDFRAERGEWTQAAERYRQATDIYGSSVEGWYKLGHALSELGRRDDARAALGEALASYRTAPWYRRSEDRPWKRRAARLLRPLR